MFVDMCILLGCDYLQKIPGLNIKKAHEVVHKNRPKRNETRKAEDIAASYIRRIKFTTKCRVPTSYRDGFARAKWTFTRQRIYCKDVREMRELRDSEAKNAQAEPAGKKVEPARAVSGENSSTSSRTPCEGDGSS